VTPSAYEVIIVLGAAVWPGERPSLAMQRRVRHAVHLLQQGHAPYLLCTGGVGLYPPAEAEVMQRLAVAQGVSAACIVQEDQATSTFTSAVLCSTILRQRGWTRVLVVTDRYHLPRTLLAFWSCGIRAVGRAAPGRPARGLRRRLYYYCREVVGCVWYSARAIHHVLHHGDAHTK
jgi:uncharacterized SAM-binding protein YcdF (DUF218 family)